MDSKSGSSQDVESVGEMLSPTAVDNTANTVTAGSHGSTQTLENGGSQDVTGGAAERPTDPNRYTAMELKEMYVELSIKQGEWEMSSGTRQLDYGATIMAMSELKDDGDSDMGSATGDGIEDFMRETNRDYEREHNVLAPAVQHLFKNPNFEEKRKEVLLLLEAEVTKRGGILPSGIDRTRVREYAGILVKQVATLSMHEGVVWMDAVDEFNILVETLLSKDGDSDRSRKSRLRFPFDETWERVQYQLSQSSQGLTVLDNGPWLYRIAEVDEEKKLKGQKDGWKAPRDFEWKVLRTKAQYVAMLTELGEARKDSHHIHIMHSTDQSILDLYWARKMLKMAKYRMAYGNRFETDKGDLEEDNEWCKEMAKTDPLRAKLFEIRRAFETDRNLSEKMDNEGFQDIDEL